MNNEYKLTAEILLRSEAKLWWQAIKEWDLKDVYLSEEANTCLCSHYPIYECCVIENQINGYLVTVGNCCVKKFLDNESDLIFKSIKAVSKNIVKALNAATIEYMRSKKVINDWEYEFYLDTIRKRKLSSAQNNKRIEINKKIISFFRKSKPDTQQINNEFKKPQEGLFDF